MLKALRSLLKDDIMTKENKGGNAMQRLSVEQVAILTILNDFDKEILYSQGDNGNIIQANNSKNESIKQEQFKETKKENWLIRFFKWVRDFWLQLFIGIITGIISTLIVEWILGVFSK